MTALMYACQSCHAALASYLIPLSDTNRQDTYGWSVSGGSVHYVLCVMVLLEFRNLCNELVFVVVSGCVVICV